MSYCKYSKMPAAKPKSACTRIQNLDHCTDPCTKVVPKKPGRRPYCRTKHKGRNGKGCGKGTRKSSSKTSTLKRRPSASRPKRTTIKKQRGNYATIEQFQELTDRLAQVETKVMMMDSSTAVSDMEQPDAAPETPIVTEPEELAETMEPTTPTEEEPSSDNEAEAAMADAASPEEEKPLEQQADEPKEEESSAEDPNATSSITGAIANTINDAPDPVADIGSSIKESFSNMMSSSSTESEPKP